MGQKWNEGRFAGRRQWRMKAEETFRCPFRSGLTGAGGEGIIGRMKETTYRVKIPMDLALLGDLHGQPWQEVVNSLRRNRPEVIAIAGDIVYGQSPVDDLSPLVTQPYILPFLEHCAEIAPSFLSLGNHEWMLDERDLGQIRSTGVRLLDNDFTEYGGAVFGGLTSAVVSNYREYKRAHPQRTERYPQPRAEEIDVHLRQKRAPELGWLEEFRRTAGVHVLLCHHPEYYPLIPEGIELVLSCHAHGGQWRFFNPVKRRSQGVFAPGQGTFPKWTKGVYEGRLVVSAGLANTAWVPRLFNPTEVVYLRG